MARTSWRRTQWPGHHGGGRNGQDIMEEDAMARTSWRRTQWPGHHGGRHAMARTSWRRTQWPGHHGGGRNGQDITEEEDLGSHSQYGIKRLKEDNDV